MNPAVALSFTSTLHAQVHRHLFPGDGLEAAAILVCSQVPGPRKRLLAKEAVLVPYAACTRRERDFLTWPGLAIEEAIDRAEKENLSLILIHSHPGGLFGFSAADDASDKLVIPGLFHALGSLHGTAIMVPDGAVLARLYEIDMKPHPVELVTAAGHDIKLWWCDGQFARRPVAFTSQTRDELAGLCACVIGVSGTGSIIAEQLARLGFGRILLIDFDRLELRNLNRILNSTMKGAADRLLKVEAFADAVSLYRGPGVAIPVARSIMDREAVLQASQADVLFSCVDTLEGRQIADLIAATFLMPLLDVGVVIPTRKSASGPAVADVCGRIDYVYPGGSTLSDRGVYDPAGLRAEYLRNAAPAAHRDEVRDGYIKGMAEEAPSVITLNMRAASACVMELIARLYPFRHEPNSQYVRTEFSLAACEEEFHTESSFRTAPNPVLARGAAEPLLGLPALRGPRDKGRK